MDTAVGAAMVAIVVIAVIVLGYAAIARGSLKEIKFGEGRLGFRLKAQDPVQPSGTRIGDVKVETRSGIDAPAGAPVQIDRTEVKDDSHITIH